MQTKTQNTKERKGTIKRIVVVFFAFLFATPPFFAYADESLMRGVTQGTNTHFAITDSDYLPLTLDSSEFITLRLESVPNIVTMVINAATSSVTSTTITIGGFLPNTTYYKYTDSYHNLTPFTTDTNGVYFFTQDITAPHIIFIQSHKSTKFLRDDVTGGDCTSIGSWNSDTKTCTLMQNLFETVEIDSDNITLDGNNFTLSGFHTGSGVYLSGRLGVTIKNLNIENFSYGVIAFSSLGNHIVNNHFTNNDYQGIVIFNSNTNTITGNSVSLSVPSTNRHQGFALFGSHDNFFQNNTINLSTRASYHQGILLFSSNNNSFISNTVSDVYQGILLFDSNNNSFVSNLVSDTYQGILLFDSSNNNSFVLNIVSDTYQGVLLFGSSNNVLRENTIRKSKNAGLSVFPPSNGNQVYHNDFLQNGTHAVNYSVAGNMFNLPRPDGGNYWDTFDTLEEGCGDTNTDGFCDVPRIFTNGQDNLPWTTQDGWNSVSNQAPTLSFATDTPLGLYEDDGVQDRKGTAEKTLFAFSVMYTSVNNITPSMVSVLVGNGVSTTTLPMKIDTSATTIQSDGNFTNGEQYVATSTFAKGDYRYYFEASDGTTIVRSPDASALTFGAGYSNVLFLPGFEASRLYRSARTGENGTEKLLWEPTDDTFLHDLFLNINGGQPFPFSSLPYTRDVIDEAYFNEIGPNIYKSFMSDLESWKNTGHLIADYSIVPYDWRFAPQDILARGIKTGENISYIATSSNPYIKSELARLVATSKTGKITIIAHSNGGLVAKMLLKQLEDANDPLLASIDTLVLVASPQIGTPQAMGGLLYGYEQGIPKSLPGPLQLLSNATAREFGENLPGAYTLLPSRAYFTSVHDANHPLVSFDNSATFSREHLFYGNAIGNVDEFYNFLLGVEGRPKPFSSNLEQANVLNANILPLAIDTHNTIDDWVPPPSITLHQIAGWGVETLAGIKYHSFPVVNGFGTTEIHTPDLVYDGDGTVVVPSALFVSTSTENVQRWWVNLGEYNKKNIDREHPDILEVPSLRQFIKESILTHSTTTLPEYFTSFSPPAENIPKSLTYFLHSPLSLSATDDMGNIVSIATSTIPGARYREFGEVKFLSIPANVPHHLVLDGYGSGSFTLEMQEVENGEITATTTFVSVPTATTTKVTMDVTDGTIANASSLRVDADGNGTTDFSLIPKVGELVYPDLTPPEAVITFSTSTQTLFVSGIDDSGLPVSVTATTTVIDEEENSEDANDDDNDDSENAETIFTLTDQSGNILAIPLLKYTEKKHQTTLSFNTLVYNRSTTTIATTTLKYQWEMNKKGMYTMFSSTITIGATTTTARYDQKKNRTIITTKHREGDGEDGDDEQFPTTTVPGMVIPGIVTYKGGVGVRY